MKLKFFNIAKTLTLIASLISLVAYGEESKKESGSQSTAPKVKLAFMTNATADFWSYGKAGAEKAASEHDDIEIEFLSLLVGVKDSYFDHLLSYSSG